MEGTEQAGPQAPESELPRELSLLDSTMINAGCMIGSGIFIVPASIALHLHSSLTVILIWTVGGIVSLFGALSVAELGAMMPKAGGQYVYLRQAYGPIWGFLYGWAAFACINTASIAAIAVTFAFYLGYFFPMGHGSMVAVAIASIALLTGINCFGIRFGAIVQNGFTFLKIASLILLVLFCFALTGGSTSNFSPVLPAEPLSGLAGPLLLSMVAALFAYDGWIEITYVAGEVKNPNRTIPRSLLLSTLIVVALYVAVNCALIYVIPLTSMAGSPMVASDAAMKIMGTGGAAAVAIAVVISTFGANNGFVFTCPRIYYAMSKEGMFFRWLSRIHPRYRTPIPSLIVQGVLASILVYSGTFDQLATYVVFASWFFYAMSATAVFLFRFRKPLAARPYKVWGYPYTPLLFILFAIYLVLETIVEDPRDSLIGAGIVLAGIPVYLFWRKKGPSGASANPPGAA